VTGRRGKPANASLLVPDAGNVKVGREPFDAHVRRALEATIRTSGSIGAASQYTDPSMEPEYWRERRRAERIVRRLQEDEDALEATAEAPTPEPADRQRAARSGQRRRLRPRDIGAMEAVDGQRGGVSVADWRGKDGVQARRRRRRGQRGSAAPGPPVSSQPTQTE